MNIRLLLSLLAALLAVVPGDSQVRAQDSEPLTAPVRYDEDFPAPAFHEGRRQALLNELPDTAYALILSAPERRRDQSVQYAYRQSSDLYYLSGTHEPNSVLLLAPHGIEAEGRSVNEILFVPERTSYSDTWLGRRFGTEGAMEELEIDLAFPTADFERFIAERLADSSIPIYALLPTDPPALDSELHEQIEVVLGLAAAQPEFEARALLLRQMLDRLRAVKEPEELRLMRRAIDITADAHRTAMRLLEPGMHEYEVAAAIEYVFARSGAEAPAFRSIVGSGENATILHYESNRRQIEDGDLVLMDIGAEYRYYAADVTRTVPANGRFSEEQRQIYQLVLDATEAGIEAAMPGMPFDAPDAAARMVLEAGLRDLGILRDGQDLSQYFMHSTSHFLGLSVHDVGSRSVPLEAGNVITVEPGLYFRPSSDLDERWWNIGVRIEDDVLITEDGPEVLSSEAPKRITDIEAMMAEECKLTAEACR